MTRGPWDALVVGAGFGGLGAALRLAERGARVLVLEALRYPGGCAATFERGGARHEAGATLFSGLEPGGLFGDWIERYGLDVTVERLDPVVEFRSPDLRLDVRRDRAAFEESLCALPGAPVAALRRFLAHQRAVADLLWSALDDPTLLPPLRARDLPRLARLAPRALPLLRDVGRPLRRVVERYGLGGFEPLRQWLDAVCQITVQCSAAEAEAPFALGALDYFWRGAGHVRGGIGELARGLVRALESHGGEVRFASRVTRIERAGSGWRAHTTRGVFEAPSLLANLVPRALDRVLAESVPRPRALERLARRVDGGWGACMLYLELEPDGAPPRHLELVDDPARPFVEGNHVFCSLAGARDGPRTRAGRVTATVSTHVALERLRALDDAGRAELVRTIQERMRATLRARAPELEARVASSLPASPRTFERFTGRPDGAVGGVPRRAGLRHYAEWTAGRIAPGLELVGDSVFPGQSTLAAALGGWKAAERAFARRAAVAPSARLGEPRTS